jgi:hypothetical protein
MLLLLLNVFGAAAANRALTILPCPPADQFDRTPPQIKGEETAIEE